MKETIRKILPCLGPPGRINIPHPTPETIALLEDECARMSQRITQLTRNRDAMSVYLAQVRRAARPESDTAETAG